MKLAEAILENKFLERQIELLQSRINEERTAGRGTGSLQEDTQRKANLLRDLTISIAWTEQTSLLSGLPLGAYRIRIDIMKKLASIFEPVNRERADNLLELAHNDEKFIEAAIWLIDLKIPKVDDKEDQ